MLQKQRYDFCSKVFDAAMTIFSRCGKTLYKTYKSYEVNVPVATMRTWLEEIRENARSE